MRWAASRACNRPDTAAPASTTRDRDLPGAERTARFECALALASGGELIEVFSGRVEGRLLEAPRGEGGFGYDPVFFYEETGRTFAEMSREEKAAVSHRGRALEALRRYLKSHPALP
jgi:XTP/dITP diphosphohydrolase